MVCTFDLSPFRAGRHHHIIADVADVADVADFAELADLADLASLLTDEKDSKLKNAHLQCCHSMNRFPRHPIHFQSQMLLIELNMSVTVNEIGFFDLALHRDLLERLSTWIAKRFH